MNQGNMSILKGMDSVSTEENMYIIGTIVHTAMKKMRKTINNPKLYKNKYCKLGNNLV